MEETKALGMIKINPSMIKTIENPTYEMINIALKKDGLLLRYIKNPEQQLQEIAFCNNKRAIEYIDNPSEDMMSEAVKDSWSNLKYIENPTDKVIELAVNQKGWAIQYVKKPSIEMQMQSVKKDYDSIKYIDNPCEEVQIEAVKIKYDALRYINKPCLKAQIQAVRLNEAAINFIDNINKENISIFLKENILIIKYIFNKVSKEEVMDILQEVIQDDNVSEKYIRDFINCSVIDVDSDKINLDKIMFICKYGSKKAKKIAVDEKLSLLD